MNKPFFVTVASATPNTNRFVDSLKHIKDQVEMVSIQFNPPIENLPVFKKYEESYCGNLKRFDYIPKLDDNRFMIFSDIDDVVFQRPLPDLERMGYEVYLGHENVKHKDSFWKPYIERNKYFEPLLERPVYNGGLFAMRGFVFTEYKKYIKTAILNVDPADMRLCDQLLLNMFFIKFPNYGIYSKQDIFCPLYKNFELGLVKKRLGLFSLSDGHVPVAIHANGNTKELFIDGRRTRKNEKKI